MESLKGEVMKLKSYKKYTHKYETWVEDINKVFEIYYESNNNNIMDLLQELVKNKHTLEKIYKYYRDTDTKKNFFHRRVKRKEWKWGREHPSKFDDRSGKETYGYESIDSIKNNLNYIYGKWQCAFRVRWLLDLIESILS